MVKLFRLSTSRVFAIALFFVLLLLGSVVWYATERLKEEALQSSMHIAALHAKSYERYFSQHLDGLKLVMENISSNLTFGSEEKKQKAEKLLRNALANAPYLRSLAITDQDGRVLYSSNTANQGHHLNVSGFYPKPFGHARILQFGGIWSGRDIYEGSLLGPEHTAEAKDNSFLPVMLGFEKNTKGYKVLALLNPLFFVNHYLQNSETSRLDVAIQDLSGTTILSTLEEDKTGALLFSGKLNAYLEGPLNGELILDEAGNSRIIAYKSSRMYPFVIVVSTGYERALSEWTKERDNILLVTVSVAVVLTLLSIWMFIKSQQQRLRLLEEERLEAQRRKRVLETIPSAVVMLDETGCILMHNGHWESFALTCFQESFLKKRVEPLLETLWEGKKDKDAHMHELHEVIAGHKASFVCEYGVFTGEQEKHYSLHINAIHEPNLVGSVLTQIDITEKTLAQKQLQETLQSLHSQVGEAVQKTIEQDHIIFEQRRHQALSTLIVNIAHQWRQPLQVIAASMDTMEFENEKLQSQKITESLDTIDKEIRYLSDIIRFFTEIYKDQTSDSKEVVVVKTNLKRLLQLLRYRLEEQNIHVTFEVPEDLVVFCSEKDFSEMFLEMIENAISIREVRELPSLEMTIYAIVEEKQVELLVTDNGGGFEEEMLPHIFDPYVTSFFKSRNKGLGLYHVRMIMQNRCRGTVHAGNVDGGGCIKLVFPKDA